MIPYGESQMLIIGNLQSGSCNNIILSDQQVKKDM
jgi:hypothetical protein